KPYAPIKHLLALWQSYILSPTSTPESEPINKRTGKLIGTGPFIFDSCQVNIGGYIMQTDMHANPDYWGGKPSINRLRFLSLEDPIERMERMLSGELSYAMGVRSNYILDMLRSAPGINVIPKKSLNSFHISMNNLNINATMRRAISYAFNYSRYIEEIWGGHAERARSPLPKKMPYSNWDDFDVPYYNISRARQILKDANWPGTKNLTANNNITARNEWAMLANSSTPLCTYNFSSYNWWMDSVANLFIEDLKQIGLKVNLIRLGQLDFWDKMESGELELFTDGWGAAMLDPVEIINPCYSYKLDGAEGNYINFNDTQIQQWMEGALEEFNETTREQLYFNIQKRLIEQLNPVMWLVFPISYDIWNSAVRGIPIEGAQLKFMLKDIYLNLVI
ncbi:MAG: ABC transporter substrate-binding protein, partial [Promethearchaeota archaeon]